jgi:putative endonuclease
MVCHVYILANERNGTLYTRVTNDLARRVVEHREGKEATFTRRYGTQHLVYVDAHEGVREAIAREKRIKRWKRRWKLALIEEFNPGWRDVLEDITV